MATTRIGIGGDKRWSLVGTTALITGGTRGIGLVYIYVFLNLGLYGFDYSDTMTALAVKNDDVLII